ncbi:MAG: DUF711 family protein [Candidatus Bathyarchaeia archaeon]
MNRMKSVSVKIRALTLYLNPNSWDFKDIIEYVSRRVSRFHSFLDDAEWKKAVWSVRVSIPPPPDELNIVKLAEVIYESSFRSGVSLVSGFTIKSENIDYNIVEQLLQIGVYVCIDANNQKYFRRIAEALLRIAQKNPVLLSKVAVKLGQSKRFLTPYFPLSSNVEFREGLAIALLYSTDLLKAYQSNGIKGLIDKAGELMVCSETYGLEASSNLGIDFYGLDYSISPWMEDSSARLVEEISGVPIPEPGSIAAVVKLNGAIYKAALKSNIKSTGFCELMLPVAEDNILKQRVLEGRLRLRDLTALSMVCVAGVDMAVIPAENSVKTIEGLLRDMSKIAKTKGRVLGVRLIPYYHVKSGESVDLGLFGTVPVISP